MGTDRINGSIYTNIRGRIATIEFGHPAGNSFVSEMLGRLADAFSTLADNDGVSVIILKSEGDRAFCAGASINELRELSALDEATAFFNGFASVVNAMRRCGKPVLGRIQGKTVGGGVGLVAACDYVFATVAADIRLSELSIGIAPLVIAPAVERKLGKDGFAALALSPGEWQNAYWAQKCGLYTKVYDKLHDLDKDLGFFAQTLSAYPIEALKAIKDVLWEDTGHWDTLLPERAAHTARLSLLPQARASIEAFGKK
jgi:methylglutaconyl-CoA hydratase